MSKVEARLKELGHALPAPLKLPPGMALAFPWVRVRGNLAFISGHGPQHADGSLAAPLGKVGADLTVEQGKLQAQRCALSVLGSLQRALGDLDRVQAWLRVFGMVNSARGFSQQPLVINGFSELILALYGPERGQHARSAVGMAELPLGMPVEVEAVVEIS